MRRTVAVLGGVTGNSPGLVAVRTQVEQLLRRQSGSRRLPPILILGETGTGKGLFASAIHDAGPRAAGPFVAVNCAAIPETLLEAELFGFEQGAFTDARHAKAGLFQTANRGTLFLDEIGLLPQSLQAKLLTVLEDRTVRRLGSTRSDPVDVWIISATSEDLQAGARRRGFREELYHRLAVVTLQLPALRERGQDILTLAEHFLARTCRDYGLAPKTLAEDARATLLAYRWPGNVRELANLMERVALLTDSRRVTADMLKLGPPPGRPASRPPDDHARPARAAPKATSLEHAVGEVEQARILQALHETRGNISQAADRLGVTRNILRYRLKKYGLQATSGTAEPPTQAEPVSHPLAPPPVARTTHVQWERRHVALLRADLVPTAPGGAVFHAGGALETLVEKIESFGGQVEEISPQGLVAVFGLEPIEDAPRRAAHAALAIQRIAERARGRSVESPRARIGLHVGEVLVAWVGTAARVDHAAKRDAWRQLEAFMPDAEAGTVLVSEATRPFLERRFLLSTGTAGSGPAGMVYRLVGLEPTGLGLGARLTPFVGRGRELEQFAQVLEQAQGDHGQVVAVVGEAGVGKSRLLWEFINSDRVRDSLMLVSSAASYGKAMPYLLVIDLLKRYFKIEPRDDADTIKERITEKLLSLERGLASAVSAVLALLDVAVDDAQWQTLDPQQKRRRTLEAVKLLLLEESRRRPVVLVFEDLHWIDSETQAVLDTLVESLPSHRVLLFVSYRPEYQHTWGGKTYYRQLRIDPLPPESADELLDALLGADVALVPLKRLLVERTEANPLFLEESVRALVEMAALAGERGAYRLTRPVENLKIPATVQAILAARMDRLAPEAKRLLQAAAVIGKDVPMPLLMAIADAAEHDVRAELMRLQAAEFLYETRLFPDLEYTFKHALTHEVAYQGLLHDRQRALHARITEAIERLSPERVAEHAERLAYHALRGELWDKAVAYLRQAGLRAMARGAYREAIAHLGQALGALRHIPETRETTELTIDIHIDLRNALLPLGDWARMGEHLHEAEGLARTLGDQHRLARIATFMVIQCLRIGDYDEAVRFGQEGLSIARTLGDRPIEVVATSFLGMTHAARGEFSDAVTFLERNVALEGDLRYERFGAPAIQSALSGAWLADVLSQLGRFNEAIEHAEAAVRTAEAADHPFTLHFGLLDLGLAHLRRGDLPHATRVLERGLDLCRTWQLVVATPVVAATLGTAYAFAGRDDEALPLVAGAVEEFRGRQIPTQPALILLSAGITCLRVGRIDEAASHAREALALTRRLGARGSEAHALCLAGDVASRGGATDAEGYYRQALALAKPRGMRPLAAHCHLGLGKLYRRTSGREQAQEHMTIATTMYREMGMTYWLEQAEEAEMRKLA